MATIASILGASALIAAASSLSHGHASGLGLAAEFEAIGEDGWDGLPTRIRHVSTGIVLVLIPPGSVTLGSPDSELERDRDEDQRDVAIEKGFYLGETEVTIGQWTQVMGELPAEVEQKDDDTLPVQGVSWYNAIAFTDVLNKQGTGGWRLPTEAEWEYACRAGTKTPFSFGENITTSQVNFDGERPYGDGERGVRREAPVPVRTLPANPWGLYEMHGNVWEWCEDLYVVRPALDAANDVPGASRVLRGGDWSSQGKKVRSANRDGYPPSSSSPKYGFRLVVSDSVVR